MSWCCWTEPLQRLRLFGFLCPCHESEDEYDARDAIHSLQSLSIQWCRTAKNGEKGSVEIVLDATLKVVDYAMGPALQITCSDPRRLEHEFVDSKLVTTNLLEVNTTLLKLGKSVLTYWISLDKIGKVDCNENDNVIITGADEKEELLRFRLGTQKDDGVPCSSQETVEQLQALLRWDGFRRLDIIDDIRREQAWLLEKEILAEDATDDEEEGSVEE